MKKSTILTLLAAAQLFSLNAVTPTIAVSAENCGAPCVALQRQMRVALRQLVEIRKTNIVPFTVNTTGGICNTAAIGSANPVIEIDSDGRTDFVVSSILVKTAGQGRNEGYRFFSINNVSINGQRFDTRTGNLTQPVSGFAVNESADLMGTPIRLSSITDDGPTGGNFPFEITANGSSPIDISITLFCRADDYDLSIDSVRVSGWARARDNVTVTYQPGI